MSGLLIHILEAPIEPIPAAVRVRRWLPVGGVLTWREVRLQLLADRDADGEALPLSWCLRVGSCDREDLLPLQPLRLDHTDQVHVVPRGLAVRPCGRVEALFLELRAARLAALPLLHAC